MPTGRPDAFPFEWVVDWYRSVIDAKVKKKNLIAAQNGGLWVYG
jgi:hypothetical protein